MFNKYSTNTPTSTTSQNKEEKKILEENPAVDQPVDQQISPQIPMTRRERMIQRAWRIAGWITVIVIGTAVSFYYYVDDALKKGAKFSEQVAQEMKQNQTIIKYAGVALEKGWPILYEITDLAKNVHEHDQTVETLRSVLGEIRDPQSITLLNPNFIQMIVHKFCFFAKRRQSILGFYRNFRESRIDYYFPIVNVDTNAVALLKVSLITNDKLVNDLKQQQQQQDLKRETESSDENQPKLTDALTIDSVSIVDAAPLVMEYGPEFFESNLSYNLRPENLVYSWPLSRGGEFKLKDARLPQDIVDPQLTFITGPMTTPSMTPVMGFMFVESLPPQVIPK